eukprot:TRINITY_DN11539_c0_g3_i2.p1 TRINITY_DN11539_c0_g3~~TRINITY_DN11539_c0_g3_i2.p1  ORF type:complete len:386 (-),score=49.59 TRINITY_DN11539_c0_g3_i2:166-1323(-)
MHTSGWSLGTAKALDVITANGPAYSATVTEQPHAIGARQLYSLDELGALIENDGVKRALDILCEMEAKKEFDHTYATAHEFQNQVQKDSRRLQQISLHTPFLGAFFQKASALALKCSLDSNIDAIIGNFLTGLGIVGSVPFCIDGCKRFVDLCKEPSFVIGACTDDSKLVLLLRSRPKFALALSDQFSNSLQPPYFIHCFSKHTTRTDYDPESGQHIGEGLAISLYNYLYLLVDHVAWGTPMPDHIVTSMARTVGSVVSYGRMEIPTQYFEAVLRNKRPAAEHRARFIADAPNIGDEPVDRPGCGDDLLSCSGRSRFAQKVLSVIVSTMMSSNRLPMMTLPTVTNTKCDRSALCADLANLHLFAQVGNNSGNDARRWWNECGVVL